MKTLFLCSDTQNNRALAKRIAVRSGLAAIALIDLPRATKRSSLLTRAVSFTLGRPLRQAWFGMLDLLGRGYPSYPEVPLTRHHGVNSQSVSDLVDQVRPGLVLVSGTDLLRKDIIATMKRHGKVMNLHTGISPFIKGGPNCTNWALAMDRFDLIGNTVMWIDAGIDTGALIATEQTLLHGTESLMELHRKVMDHAHDLYVRAADCFVAGHTLNHVPQRELGKGELYFTRDWNSRRIIAAISNFRRKFRPDNPQIMRPIPLVSLHDPYSVNKSA